MEQLLGRVKVKKGDPQTKSGFAMPRKSRLVETTAVVNAGLAKKGGKLKDTKAKPNKWLLHLKAFRAKHPNISLKMAMMGAKESYKK